ncbi:MAG TPA: DUF4215 domain-containing protein [Candidatus Nanoarchaeia archaeon]|nr:DUF4215 domain-containing protein [Candidatus Nanoarchaeia archaeon]
MKRSVFIIFGLLLINILFISADPCQTSDGVTCCYGTCNWGLPGPDSTDGSCGGQCQNWGCVACAPSCSPSCACAVNTCTGQSCDDGCGGTCAGTKCCSTCGDSLIQCSETCDDGNTQSGDGCSNVCITETYSSNYCGDNVIFPLFETCDDGNKISFDGCSSTCLIETYDDDYCGDNVLFVGSEGCDDGNLINLDGCSSTCNVEIYDNSYCGDGVLFIGSEGCDDGNIISGDSCSSTCKVETYDNSYCGDGIMFKGFEECDDRNKVNGDGCSSVCVLQPEAYFLNSNGQRITEAHIGETVKLVFNNTGILNGSFSFEIFEDDPAFDDEIRTGINAISGTFSNIGWGIIIGEWTITEQDYSITEIGDYDGFYFKINGFESNRLEILVQDVTPWCSNYETEVSCSDCDYIGCDAAENSVNEKVFEAFPEVWNDTQCGDEIAGPDPSCSYLMFCKCIWNSSRSKCDYTWGSSPGLDCDTDSSIPTVGSCKYSESTVDNCNDGFLEYSWSTAWTWGIDNGYAVYSNGPSDEVTDYVLENGLYYYDPFKFSQRCIGGSNIIPCPAEIQLPFFGFYNLIITIFLIAGVYSIISLRKD